MVHGGIPALMCTCLHPVVLNQAKGQLYFYIIVIREAHYKLGRLENLFQDIFPTFFLTAEGTHGRAL
jgi:hypothetical protein